MFRSLLPPTIAHRRAIVTLYLPMNSNVRYLKSQASTTKKGSGVYESMVKTKDSSSQGMASASLKRSIDRAREWMEKSGGPMVSIAWKKAKDLSGRGVDFAKERVVFAVRQSSQAVLSKTKELTSAAISHIRSFVERSLTVAASWIRKQVSRATSALIDPIRSTLNSAMERIRQSHVDWSKFWWQWSLTAIAVYGIATTVPKEIVRQTLRSRDDDTKND